MTSDSTRMTLIFKDELTFFERTLSTQTELLLMSLFGNDIMSQTGVQLYSLFRISVSKVYQKGKKPSQFKDGESPLSVWVLFLSDNVWKCKHD